MMDETLADRTTDDLVALHGEVYDTDPRLAMDVWQELRSRGVKLDLPDDGDEYELRFARRFN